MSDQAWIALIVTAAVIPLVGVVYGILRSSQTKTDERLDQHIGHDIEAHERLAKLETRVEQLDGEVTSLRKRWHDFYDHGIRGLGDMFEAKVKGFKEEIERRFGK